MKYFGTEKDPGPDQMPTGDQTLEDYQYDYQQIATDRDWAIAGKKGRPKRPKVPADVKKYQKEVRGRTVTDRQWGRMTPEQQQAAMDIAEAHKRAKGGGSKKLPSKKGAAARNLKNTFGRPAPGLLAPTGQMTGPPMNLQMIKRMMEQGGSL
ncbi:MAG: hypothetical protein ACXABY_36830 [Candidatus Thorarchaeota archaeon]|jgi:hypothetical protein